LDVFDFCLFLFCFCLILVVVMLFFHFFSFSVVSANSAVNRFVLCAGLPSRCASLSAVYSINATSRLRDLAAAPALDFRQHPAVPLQVTVFSLELPALFPVHSGSSSQHTPAAVGCWLHWVHTQQSVQRAGGWPPDAA
jgi:hypothetical protein